MVVVAGSKSAKGLRPLWGCGSSTAIMGIGLRRWTGTMVMSPSFALAVVAQSLGLVALSGSAMAMRVVVDMAGASTCPAGRWLVE
jgi:hypothetical protein